MDWSWMEYISFSSMLVLIFWTKSKYHKGKHSSLLFASEKVVIELNVEN